MEARTLLSSTKSTVGILLPGLALVMLPVSVVFQEEYGQTPLNYRKGLWI